MQCLAQPVAHSVPCGQASGFREVVWGFGGRPKRMRHDAGSVCLRATFERRGNLMQRLRCK